MSLLMDALKQAEYAKHSPEPPPPAAPLAALAPVADAHADLAELSLTPVEDSAPIELTTPDMPVAPEAAPQLRLATAPEPKAEPEAAPPPRGVAGPRLGRPPERGHGRPSSANRAMTVSPATTRWPVATPSTAVGGRNTSIRDPNFISPLRSPVAVRAPGAGAAEAERANAAARAAKTGALKTGAFMGGP